MDDLKSIIIGSLLGDGSLSKIATAKANSRMSFGHSEKQLEYLKWKLSIFQKYNLATGNINKCTQKSIRYISGQCVSYHSQTRQNAIFTYYRKAFYPEGKKVLNMSELDISPMALAIWFMDDDQKCTRSYQINTQSFDTESLNKLCQYLCDKYQLLFTIDKNNVLYLRTESIEKFEYLIKPYMHESMIYKLMVLNKLG